MLVEHAWTDKRIENILGNLQRAGVIRYRRGHIAVLERSGLETRVCECYATVKKELRRLLSDVQYRRAADNVADHDFAPTTARMA